MKKHPKTFDALYTNMIAAGEAGGILDGILKRLATYIEKAVKLKGQVKSAMIYPIAVIVIATVVVGVDPVEGHSDVREPLRRPRRRAAAADAHRHRGQQSAWCGSCRSSSSAGVALGYAFKRYYATDEGPARRSTRSCSKLPILGPHACARSPSRASAARCRR